MLLRFSLCMSEMQGMFVSLLDDLVYVVLLWCDGIMEVRVIAGRASRIFMEFTVITKLSLFISCNNGNCIFILVNVNILLH
jgi:hypothetical protein